MKKLFFSKKVPPYLPSWKRVQIPSQPELLKIIFLFLRWDMLVPSRLFSMNHPPNPISFHLKSTSLSQLGVVFNAFETFYGKTFEGLWCGFLFIVYTTENERMEAKNEGLVQMLFLFLSVYFPKKTAGFQPPSWTQKMMEKNLSFPGSMAWTMKLPSGKLTQLPWKSHQRLPGK